MKSYREFLTEFNKGIDYENEVIKNLKRAGVTPIDFFPAGASNAPDGVFLYKGKEYFFEIKESQKDFGQSAIKYQDGKWIWSGTDSTIQRDLDKAGVLKKINKEWKQYGSPLKYTALNFTDKDRAKDYKNFTDLFFDAPINVLYSYYASKDVYYIQIKGKGLYYLEKNPANLDVDQYKPELIIRVRIKGKSTSPSAYNFTTAIQTKSDILPSKHDLDGDLSFLKNKHNKNR